LSRSKASYYTFTMFYTTCQMQTNQLLSYSLQSLHHVKIDVLREALSCIVTNSLGASEKLFTAWQISNQLSFIVKHRNNPLVNEFISRLSTLELTSYDYMVLGTTERSQFHPYTAIKHFEKSLELNPLNYEVIIYFANAAQELDQELNAVNMGLCGKKLIETILASLPPMEELEILGASMLKPLYHRLHSFRHVVIGKILSQRAEWLGDVPLMEGLNRDEHYHKALEWDPHSIHANFYLAYTEGCPKPIDDETEQHKSAIRHFEAALKCVDVLNGPIYEALTYNNIASTYLKLKEIDIAMKYVKKALIANPRLGWSYYVRSMAIYSLDESEERDANLEKAIDDLTMCIETLVPEKRKTMCDMMSNRALIQFRLDNDVSNLVRAIEKCLAVDNGNGFAHYYRLTAFLAHGYRDEAHAHMSTDDLLISLFDEAMQACIEEDLYMILEKRFEFYGDMLQHKPSLINKSQFDYERYYSSFDRIE
jgi:tetratricopeptide (TPR) repeat protein